ncbi:MAG: hypothetical protein ACREYE_31700 [Gammaproteobacteria bacterium]
MGSPEQRGAGLSRAIHHPEIGGNVVLYNVVAHRYTYEMEQELTGVANRGVRVHFTPCYVPICRSIGKSGSQTQVTDRSRSTNGNIITRKPPENHSG